MSGKKRSIYITLLAILVIILLKLFGPEQANVSGFESYRDVTDIRLTNHAKCRMDCRHITLQEIKEIIKDGKLNRSKSGRGSQGDRTYALEGYSHEKQHIRVIVATEKSSLVVITCIDLDKEWSCHCK